MAGQTGRSRAAGASRRIKKNEQAAPVSAFEGRRRFVREHFAIEMLLVCAGIVLTVLLDILLAWNRFDLFTLLLGLEVAALLIGLWIVQLLKAARATRGR